MPGTCLFQTTGDSSDTVLKTDAIVPHLQPVSPKTVSPYPQHAGERQGSTQHRSDVPETCLHF